MYKKTTNFLPEAENGQTDDFENDRPEVKQVPPIDPQVKVGQEKTNRRKFSTPEKLKIIAAFDACPNSADRGALLRKEGLYHSSITKWRRQINKKGLHHMGAKAHKLTLANNQLVRENAGLIAIS
jgi:transposase-like protein